MLRAGRQSKRRFRPKTHPLYIKKIKQAPKTLLDIPTDNYVNICEYLGLQDTFTHFIHVCKGIRAVLWSCITTWDHFQLTTRQAVTNFLQFTSKYPNHSFVTASVANVPLAAVPYFPIQILSVSTVLKDKTEWKTDRRYSSKSCAVLHLYFGDAVPVERRSRKRQVSLPLLENLEVLHLHFDSDDDDSAYQTLRPIDSKLVPKLREVSVESSTTFALRTLVNIPTLQVLKLSLDYILPDDFFPALSILAQQLCSLELEILYVGTEETVRTSRERWLSIESWPKLQRFSSNCKPFSVPLGKRRYEQVDFLGDDVSDLEAVLQTDSESPGKVQSQTVVARDVFLEIDFEKEVPHFNNTNDNKDSQHHSQLKRWHRLIAGTQCERLFCKQSSLALWTLVNCASVQEVGWSYLLSEMHDDYGTVAPDCFAQMFLHSPFPCSSDIKSPIILHGLYREEDVKALIELDLSSQVVPDGLFATSGIQTALILPFTRVAIRCDVLFRTLRYMPYLIYVQELILLPSARGPLAFTKLEELLEQLPNYFIHLQILSVSRKFVGFWKNPHVMAFQKRLPQLRYLNYDPKRNQVWQ